MSRIYYQRHPERTVLYRVLFHYFELFLLEYEKRLEKHYGYLRSIIQEVAEKYLECGIPKNGFARLKCSDCGREKLSDGTYDLKTGNTPPFLGQNGMKIPTKHFVNY